VSAIRQALTDLAGEDAAFNSVPFYIGLTCPSGAWADEGGLAAGRKALWDGEDLRRPTGCVFVLLASPLVELLVLTLPVPHGTVSRSTAPRPSRSHRSFRTWRPTPRCPRGRRRSSSTQTTTSASLTTRRTGASSSSRALSPPVALRLTSALSDVHQGRVLRCQAAQGDVARVG
jgi:hypothetical protein